MENNVRMLATFNTFDRGFFDQVCLRTHRRLTTSCFQNATANVIFVFEIQNSPVSTRVHRMGGHVLRNSFVRPAD